MKRIAEEIRKNEQPATHPEEEDTSEYYDCLYARNSQIVIGETGNKFTT